jgi:hypothetical protein
MNDCVPVQNNIRMAILQADTYTQKYSVSMTPILLAVEYIIDDVGSYLPKYASVKLHVFGCRPR